MTFKLQSSHFLYYISLWFIDIYFFLIRNMMTLFSTVFFFHQKLSTTLAENDPYQRSFNIEITTNLFNRGQREQLSSRSNKNRGKTNNLASPFIFLRSRYLVQCTLQAIILRCSFERCDDEALICITYTFDISIKRSSSTISILYNACLYIIYIYIHKIQLCIT